ncbi:hypothetical protein BOX15_Mlig031734g1 [Macrostomum lignano]|uniref:SAM domain-containing protein n=2 Tax=Macrostomum lignano TaxID=282301 RepID=A0A1I8H5I5_9PLAT|nr:hypothetical protein BOX15_Mlig031734g1 [Macrostomum lignano]
MSSSDPQQVQLDGLQSLQQAGSGHLDEPSADGDEADFLRPIGNGIGTGLPWQRDWPPDRPGILGYMTNPLRHKKLSWFFGSEPPFLRQFLDYLGYGQYIPHFEQHNIGVRELVCLDDRGLRGIGLPKGPRARILQAVREHLPPVP